MSNEFKIKHGLIVSGGAEIETTITASSAKFIAGANSGYVLTSDSTGNATWQPSTSGSIASSSFSSTSSYGFIGGPTDGTYSDGFFPFAVSTSVADAVDDINELLNALVPAQPSALTGLSLSRSGPSIFTGRIAGGLSSSWYAGGILSGSTQTTLTAGTNLVIVSPNTSTAFRAGLASAISASLIGSVSASMMYDTSSVFTTRDSRLLSAGVGSGSNNILKIDSIVATSSIWAKANATIADVMTQTGSYQYYLSADNGAGQTNVFQIWYCGTALDFPVASMVATPVTGAIAESLVSMSGITYYGAGTSVPIYFQAQNLYRPVYYSTALQEASIQSSYFSTQNVGTGSVPQEYETLTVSQSVALTSNMSSSFGNTGSFTTTLRKPNKSDVTSANIGIGSRGICTYSTRSTALLEYFQDEVKRYTHYTQSFWASSASLVDGQLQVQNGRLIEGRFANYTSFTTAKQIYYRVFTPTNGNVQGTLTVNKNGFASFVTPWGGSGSLQIAYFLANESGSNIYDLGRAVGDNSGTIYGTRDSVSGNVINWAIPNPPGTSTSNTNPIIIAIQYSASSATDYITSLAITFANG